MPFMYLKIWLTKGYSDLLYNDGRLHSGAVEGRDPGRIFALCTDPLREGDKAVSRSVVFMLLM